MEEFDKKKNFYDGLPYGIYSRFKAIREVRPEEGLIAILKHKVQCAFLINMHKKHYEHMYIDQGLAKSIELLSTALSTWLKNQASEEEVQEDGGVNQKTEKASHDMLNKLKSCSQTTIQKLKRRRFCFAEIQ